MIGDPGPDTEALWRVAASRWIPHRTLVRVRPGSSEPPAVARDRPQVDGRATAYVCRNFACSRPVHTADELAEILA